MTGILLLAVFAAIVGTLVAVYRDRLTPRLQILFLILCELFLLMSPVVIAALAWAIPTVLKNLLILGGNREGMFVGFVAYGSAWIAVPLTIAVLDRAEERFGVPYHAPPWFWDWAIFLYAIPPTILTLDVACHSSMKGFLGILAGALAAWIGCLGVDAFARALRGRPDPNGSRRFIFYSSSYPPAIRRIFDSHPMRHLQRLFRFFRCFGPAMCSRTTSTNFFRTLSTLLLPSL